MTTDTQNNCRQAQNDNEYTTWLQREKIATNPWEYSHKTPSHLMRHNMTNVKNVLEMTENQNEKDTKWRQRNAELQSKPQRCFTKCNVTLQETEDEKEKHENTTDPKETTVRKLKELQPDAKQSTQGQFGGEGLFALSGPCARSSLQWSKQFGLTFVSRCGRECVWHKTNPTHRVQTEQGRWWVL